MPHLRVDGWIQITKSSGASASNRQQQNNNIKVLIHEERLLHAYERARSARISHVHGNKLKKGENRNMVCRFIAFPLSEIEWCGALSIEFTQLTGFTQTRARQSNRTHETDKFVRCLGRLANTSFYSPAYYSVVLSFVRNMIHKKNWKLVSPQYLDLTPHPIDTIHIDR